MKRKLVGILAGSVPLVQSLFYRNSDEDGLLGFVRGNSEPLVYDSDITPYIGNFPESFAIPALSGFLGDYIESKGIERESSLLTKLGKYFPEISAAAVSAYFTLGESILPQILPGSADINDVPSVLISSFAGYTLAKIGRSSGLQRERVQE